MVSSRSSEVLSEPGPSTAPKPKCAICDEKTSVYACPRCTTRTCSLPCSSAHKTRTGCSGVRDKAKYVPMNNYTLGTMMDDYVFLEDLGRKMGEWGQDIVRGGYGNGARRGDGRDARGRGRGGRQGRGGTTRTKRDIMKMQLELRDVDVELLPSGMERRMLNQSTWDFKKQTAFLTVEFKFYPSSSWSSNPTHSQDPPYTLVTHRNNADLPLLTLVQNQVRERTKGKKEGGCPAWLKPLILPDPDVPDAFELPQFFIAAPVGGLALDAPKIGHHRLDASQKLLTLLRHKEFVEFPAIEVWEEGSFRGVVIDADGATRTEGQERPAKRRRLDSRKGKNMMKGLLGGYGSGEDDAEDSLAVLGEYEGSDGENAVLLEGSDGEGGEAGVEAVDYAALLDLMRQAQERTGGDPDDEVDWGDSDEDS
ncbi:hypothetical protein FA95DRAFT_1057397 [Auriscalpium vulgare]|uniref:Uncharacterized protein n=1 Tax=Auriscalpium vulgare TaxID=40419 RepID=A0ACB8S9G2_9AGAM|nr:hypothetical protein FA95DRAFT_1057397 [Auriscalpium vulgare]